MPINQVIADDHVYIPHGFVLVCMDNHAHFITPKGIMFTRQSWGNTPDFSAVSDVAGFCQFDSFVAECHDDEVAMIISAQYGRMNTGRCISGEG